MLNTKSTFIVLVFLILFCSCKSDNNPLDCIQHQKDENGGWFNNDEEIIKKCSKQLLNSKSDIKPTSVSLAEDSEEPLCTNVIFFSKQNLFKRNKKSKTIVSK